MKKIIGLVMLILSMNVDAQEASKKIDLNNISTKGLDKDVAKIFKKTRQLIEHSRKKQDAQTELAGTKKWCLLLHNFNYLSQAQDCYFIIGKDDKENEKWPYLFAKASAEKGDFDKAKMGFTETLRRNENYLPAHYYRIKQNIYDNSMLEAFENYAKVPTQLLLTSSMLNLAGDLYSGTQNHFVAIGYYLQTLSLVPEAKSLNYKIAQNFQALNLIEQAQEYIKHVNETKVRVPDPYYQEVKDMKVGEVPFLIQAKAALVNGDYKSAIKDYNKALEYNPQSISALVNVAVAYYQNQNIQNAVDAFNKALTIDPMQSKALFNLASIYLSQNKIDEALENYEKYRKIIPDDPEANYQLAQIYYQKKQFDDVIQLTDNKSLQTHLQAQFIRAKVFINQQKYVQAIELLTTINKFRPNNFGILLALAKILSEVPDESLRNGTLALEYVQQAIKLDEGTQSLWQLIIVLDENNNCVEMNKNLQSFSQSLKINASEGYKKLAQQRGQDLNCTFSAE